MNTLKLRYITLSILLVLGVSLVPSCNKDEPACTTCPSSGNSDCEDIQNVKNFFAFKVGSWWVYEEETSGDRDSVYVTQYQNDPSNYNFDVRVYSSYQDYYYHFWPEYYPNNNGCPENGVLCKRCMIIKRSKYKPGDFVAEGRCFLFIPKIGDSQGSFNTAFANNRIHVSMIQNSFDLPSFTLDGRTITIFEDNTYMEGTQSTNHLFSENVGLIRKELLDSNQVWNLVDYHIVV